MAPRNYNENNVVNILAYITAVPQLSIREIPRDLNLNYSFVQRTLKRHKLHPYHIVLESDAARNLIGMKLAARCLSPFHPYLHIPINRDRQRVANFTPIRFLAASDSTTAIKCNGFWCTTWLLIAIGWKGWYRKIRTFYQKYYGRTRLRLAAAESCIFMTATIGQKPTHTGKGKWTSKIAGACRYGAAF